MSNNSEEVEDENNYDKISENDNSEEIIKYEIKVEKFKDKYLKIIKNDYYYLLDVNKYDQNSIMMKLDLEKLSRLGDKFRKYEEVGVEKLDFINFILKEIPPNESDLLDSTNLVYGLHKLFKEIDFNGDCHMQWEEFTQFIIDSVEGEDTNIKEEFGEEETDKVKNKKKMLRYRRYELSKSIIDTNFHHNKIVDCAYINLGETIVVGEYGYYKIKLYNSLTGKVINTLNLKEMLINYEFAHGDFNFKKKDKKKKQSSGPNKRVEEMSEGVKLTLIEETIGSFCVLSIFAYSYIMAICLSNSYILFFSSDSEAKYQLIYRIKTPSLQKKVWYLPNHNVWFSAGCLEMNEKFYYLNELDFESELVNSKVEIFYNENHPYRDRYTKTSQHKSEIYDVIEIKKPFLVLTACLDNHIRLINLHEKKILQMWTHHTLGVRQLDYCPNIDTSGLICSVGFEYYINLYSTELSIDDCYKGRLEGHYAPVIKCVFLGGTQICGSIDEEGFLRIWDSKEKMCLQIIPINKKNFNTAGFLFLNKINKFVAFGSKLIFYDSKFDEKIEKNKYEQIVDIFPLKVDYNRYYNNFYVLTPKDLRIYSKSGTLIKLFRKIRTVGEFENDVNLKTFIFENNHRKFYLAYTNGAIFQFNAGNGSLIKKINEYEIEIDSLTTIKYNHSREVTSMFYYYNKGKMQNYMLISTGLDSVINIHNENNPEESEILKVIRGGHTINQKSREILCMDFSLQMCRFATGSSDSLFVLWNFELTKIVDAFQIVLPDSMGRTYVSSLKFFDKYPLIFSSYGDGSCAVWDINPFSKTKKTIILFFRNYYATFYRVEPCSIIVSKFVNREFSYNIYQNKKLLFNKYFCDDEESINFRQTKRYNEDTGEPYPDIEINPKYSYKNTDPLLFMKNVITDEKNDDLLILGDEKGCIRVINMKSLIYKYEVKISQKYEVTSKFNILKKDEYNMSTILKSCLDNTHIKVPDYINLYENDLIIAEWKAHDESIIDICIIKSPFSIVSIGKDNYMRVWNEKFDLIGEINVLPKINQKEKTTIKWEFKVDEEKQMKNEIEELVQIFDKIGCKKIKFGSKEDQLAQNLSEPVKEVKKTNKTMEFLNRDIRYQRKRFKKIEKIKRKKNDEEKESEKFNEMLDGFYLFEEHKKIEDYMNKEYEPIGMNQLSKEGIRDIVNNKKEKDLFIQRQKEKLEKEKLELQNKMKKENNYRHFVKNAAKKMKKTLQSSDSHDSVKSLNRFNPFSMKNLVSEKTKTPILSKLTRNRQLNRVQSSSLFRVENGLNGSRTLKQENQGSFSQKNIFSKTGNSFMKKPNKDFIQRDCLFCQKLFRNQSASTHSLKDQMLLPFLNKKKENNKKVLKSGFERADLTLKRAFYENSYKQSCLIPMESSKNTELLKENFKSLWSNVLTLGHCLKKVSGNNEHQSDKVKDKNDVLNCLINGEEKFKTAKD